MQSLLQVSDDLQCLSCVHGCTWSLLLAVTQQAGAKQPTQHTQQDLNYDAQQAQQRTCSQVASLGGVLRKPRPVGIGHMCRAISTLTGGKCQIVGSSDKQLKCECQAKAHRVNACSWEHCKAAVCGGGCLQSQLMTQQAFEPKFDTHE